MLVSDRRNDDFPCGPPHAESDLQTLCRCLAAINVDHVWRYTVLAGGARDAVFHLRHAFSSLGTNSLPSPFEVIHFNLAHFA